MFFENAKFGRLGSFTYVRYTQNFTLPVSLGYVGGHRQPSRYLMLLMNELYFTTISSMLTLWFEKYIRVLGVTSTRLTLPMAQVTECTEWFIIKPLEYPR